MSDDEVPRLTLGFREQPPAVRPALGCAAVLVIMLGAMAAAGMVVQALLGHAAGLLAALLGAFLALGLSFLIGRGMTRAVTPPPIRLFTDRLELPAGPRATRPTVVPLAELRSVEERQTRRGALLIVASSPAVIVWPAAALVDADAGERLHAAVRAELASHAGGMARLDEMERLAAETERTMARPVRVTRALVALLAAVFALELLTGALARSEALLRLGADAPALVREGQWWRLFAANLLHLNWLHIYLNATALLSLGGLLERLIGPARLVLVCIAGGVAGNALSVLLGRHVVAAGASTIAYALLGALLVINLRHRARLPAGFALPHRRWLILLGVNGAISLLPGVDGLGHLGGMAAGALLALVLTWRGSEMGSPASPAVRAATAAMMGVTAVALALTVLHALGPPQRFRDEARRSLLGWERLDLVQANVVAWEVVTDRGSQPPTQEMALRELRRRVERGPVRPEYLDTLAWLEHRLGRPAEAVALERRAAAGDPSQHMLTSLARFLEELDTTGLPAGQLLGRDGDTLVVDTGIGGAVIYAVVDVDDRPAGLLRVVLPAEVAAARLAAPPELPAEASFRLLLAGGGGPERRGAEATAVYRSFDVTALRLP